MMSSRSSCGIRRGPATESVGFLVVFGDDMQHHEDDHARRQKLTAALQAGGGIEGEALLQIVYDELRSLARQKMIDDKAAVMLDPTSLVHKAYLRLVDSSEVTWDSRGHFFAAAAEAMRRILVDRAREIGAQKRGGDRRRVPLDSTVMDLHDAGKADVVDVNEAIARLERQDEELAAIVKLRFFAGLTIEQTALAMSMTSRTVNRRWAAARAWLLAELQTITE
jgi:RNA polymerase sigma factor (TIGR02999 family)